MDARRARTGEFSAFPLIQRIGLAWQSATHAFFCTKSIPVEVNWKSFPLWHAPKPPRAHAHARYRYIHSPYKYTIHYTLYMYMYIYISLGLPLAYPWVNFTLLPSNEVKIAWFYEGFVISRQWFLPHHFPYEIHFINHHFHAEHSKAVHRVQTLGLPLVKTRARLG